MECVLDEDPMAFDIGVVISVSGLDEPAIVGCEPDIANAFDIVVFAVFACVPAIEPNIAVVVPVIVLEEPDVDGCEPDAVVVVVFDCGCKPNAASTCDIVVAAVCVLGVPVIALDELEVDGCEPDTAVIVVFDCVLDVPVTGLVGRPTFDGCKPNTVSAFDNAVCAVLDSVLGVPVTANGRRPNAANAFDIAVFAVFDGVLGIDVAV